jgi:hypothetical protein
MPTEADRARAAFAQENAASYYRRAQPSPLTDREYRVGMQQRAAHHYAMARSILGIEEYKV